MSELRLNVLTNEWVILAPVRSERPSDLVRPRPLRQSSCLEPTCPFCPGNEGRSVETARVPGPGGTWRVRVVRNKYPVLTQGAPQLAPPDPGDRLHTRAAAYGVHEVFVDTPRHDQPPASLPLDELETLLGAYRARYRALADDPRLAHIVLFKNHGEAAGASLAHPHSQLIASPVLSGQVLERSALFERRLHERGDCLACALLADELAAGARVLGENRSFVAFTPWAALSPFHTWIMPRAHAAEFGQISDEAIGDLAEVLHRILGMLYFGLGDPDFNLVIRSGPLRGAASSYHWYLSLVPRVSKRAGFEFGSGIYINPTWPDEAAAFLRKVRLPDAP